MHTKRRGAYIFGLIGCFVFAATGSTEEPAIFSGSDFITADTRGRDRRDDRRDDRDDRQDCRQDEGRIGDDKRDCKQENRDGPDDEA